MITWLAATDARLGGWWPSSLSMSVEDVQQYLDAARIQVERFAPVLDESTLPVQHVLDDEGQATEETYVEPPVNYLQAQALQARALSRAGLTNDEGQLGYGEASVPVFPIDWTVKLLLRPPSGKSVIA